MLLASSRFVCVIVAHPDLVRAALLLLLRRRVHVRMSMPACLPSVGSSPGCRCVNRTLGMRWSKRGSMPYDAVKNVAAVCCGTGAMEHSQSGTLVRGLLNYTALEFDLAYLP